jgi:hypothetical protein
MEPALHREVKTMNSLRRKLLLFGAPVVLVGAGLTTLAASGATPTATPSAQQQAEKPGREAADPAEAAEPADTAAELAAETALPGGGHADSATDANADHQFEGVE